MVDRLVIGVGVHDAKKALLPAEQRVALVKQCTLPIAELGPTSVNWRFFSWLSIGSGSAVPPRRERVQAVKG